MRCRGCRKNFAPCNDLQRETHECGLCHIWRHRGRGECRNELAEVMHSAELDYSWDDLLAQLRRILAEHRDREPAARFLADLERRGLIYRGVKVEEVTCDDSGDAGGPSFSSRSGS